MIEQIRPHIDENWWEIQTQRTISDDFLKRYEAFLEAGAQSIESPVAFQRRRVKLSPDIYRARMGKHALVHQEVNSSLIYVSTQAIFGDQPGAKYKKFELGRSGYGQIPILYKDAVVHDASVGLEASLPLTPKQKDIISAHEAYHSLIDAETPYARKLFESILDFDALHEKDQGGWASSPDEIMSQMAELKNYFGMIGDELFTQEHLDYAKLHYAEDTGFPNKPYSWHYPYKGRLGRLFTMAETGNEQGFIDLMNTLPV